MPNIRAIRCDPGDMARLSSRSQVTRLTQIDGLRGVAVLLVMLFHFSTRYDEMLVHTQTLHWGVPDGWLGVNLFFVISGFVIFMTLEASRSPLDFVWSRFSRLYPTYWFAVVLSAALGWWFLQPGQARTPKEVLMNLTMLQGVFGVRDVDAVYWSLGVELGFYLIMLLLSVAGLLRAMAWILMLWLLLSLAAAAVLSQGGHVPFALERMAMLKWIPWFALGMIAYVIRRDGRLAITSALALALCLASIGLAGGGSLIVVASLSVGAVLLAALGRLPAAGLGPLVFIGAISYPLYLVHERTGDLIIRLLEQHQVSPQLAVTIAMLGTVLLAWLLHRGLEIPAMRGLRRLYQRSQRASANPPQQFNRTAWLIGTLSAVGLLGSGLHIGRQLGGWHPDAGPDLGAINRPQSAGNSCQALLDQGAVQVIVMGQSNAGSHGESTPPSDPTAPVWLSVGGLCLQQGDPLPGTTGHGASVWSHLSPAWRRLRPTMPIVFTPLAVGDTAIAHWTQPGPLNALMKQHLLDARSNGLPILAVLWQQGETDMVRGLDASLYIHGLRALRTELLAQRIDAPLLVARSTYCGHTGTGAIGRALSREQASLALTGVLPGPDFDVLQRPYRDAQGCHFNQMGLREAARLWAEALLQIPGGQRALP